MEHMFDAAPSVRLLATGIPAGFPSPAEDHLDGRIDLAAFLIENEAATFIARAVGDSMEGAGVYEGDLLIVNRALEPRDGNVIVAEIGGDFTLKRLRIVAGRPWLYAENPHYKPVEITEAMGFTVWGVVKHTIRMHSRDAIGR